MYYDRNYDQELYDIPLHFRVSSWGRISEESPRNQEGITKGQNIFFLSDIKLW